MWIVKVGDWYMDEFDVQWDAQRRAHRHKTYFTAHLHSMRYPTGRVVRLVKR